VDWYGSYEHIAEQIEVTPEMIEAAFDILLNHGVTDRTHEVAVDVYRAMAARAVVSQSGSP